MTSRFSIFDHFTKPLAELNAPTTPRSWVLNDVGRADFSISTADTKCTEANLQFGNLIHVQHLPTLDVNSNKNGQLPTWTGVILPNRDWDLGIIHAAAFSMEGFLTTRPMPWTKVTGTPATIFSQIVKFCNEIAPNVIINLGVVEDITASFSYDLRTNAYAHIKTLIKDSGMDWEITGEINSKGELEIYAHLYQRKGIAIGYALNEKNTESSGTMMSEQGMPSNVVFGYSQANTAQSRVTATGTNQGALDDYGFMGSNLTFPGLRDAASVASAAQAKADDRGRVKKIIPKRVVLDFGAAFSYLNTGNIIDVKNTNAGFRPGGGFGMEASARILSMDYNDLSNNCPVNLEVL